MFVVHTRMVAFCSEALRISPARWVSGDGEDVELDVHGAAEEATADLISMGICSVSILQHVHASMSKDAFRDYLACGSLDFMSRYTLPQLLAIKA